MSHTYLLYGMSDDICAIDASGVPSVIEHSIDDGDSKTIQVCGAGDTQMLVVWRYGENGVWTVTPSMVDEDTPMPIGLSLTTTGFDDPEYSMLLTIESPDELTFVDPTAGSDADVWEGVPFPKFGENEKKWPAPGETQEERNSR